MSWRLGSSLEFCLINSRDSQERGVLRKRWCTGPGGWTWGAAMVRRENIRSIRERISVAKPNLENIDSYLSDYFIYFYSAIENYLNRKCEILKFCNSPSLNIKQNSYYIYTHGCTLNWWIIPSILFPGTRVIGFLSVWAQFLKEVWKEQMPETQRIKGLPMPLAVSKLLHCLNNHSVLQINKMTTCLA